MSDRESASPLADRLTAHSNARSALLIASIWGLAEATLFFIVPDIYLGFVAIFNWRRGLWAAAGTVLGALAGGTIMYALAAARPDVMLNLLTHIPLINADMVNTVGGQLRTEGLIAMVSGPLQGIPYKVYAVGAGAQGLPFVPFLLLTIPARLERILPVVLAAGLGGALFRSFIRRRTVVVMAAYALFWISVYALYYLRPG